MLSAASKQKGKGFLPRNAAAIEIEPGFAGTINPKGNVRLIGSQAMGIVMGTTTEVMLIAAVKERVSWKFGTSTTLPVTRLVASRAFRRQTAGAPTSNGVESQVINERLALIG